LACCGDVGKACQIAFSYGIELNKVVVGRILPKLTRSTLHTHVTIPSSTYSLAFIPIPIMFVKDALTGMAKKSAPENTD
jgi:hypothetical protein